MDAEKVAAESRDLGWVFARESEPPAPLPLAHGQRGSGDGRTCRLRIHWSTIIPADTTGLFKVRPWGLDPRGPWGKSWVHTLRERI